MGKLILGRFEDLGCHATVPLLRSNLEALGEVRGWTRDQPRDSVGLV